MVLLQLKLGSNEVSLFLSVRKYVYSWGTFFFFRLKVKTLGGGKDNVRLYSNFCKDKA